VRKNTLKAAKQRAAGAKAAAAKMIDQPRWNAATSPLRIAFRESLMPAELKESMGPMFRPGVNWVALHLDWKSAAGVVYHSRDKDHFFESDRGDWCVDGWSLMTSGFLSFLRFRGDEKGPSGAEDMPVMPESELPPNPTIADYAAVVMLSYDNNVTWFEKRNPKLGAQNRFALNSFVMPAYRAATEKLKAEDAKAPSAQRTFRADNRAAMKRAYELAFLGTSETEITFTPVEPSPELIAAFSGKQMIPLYDGPVN
jgi:hypothetical protein